MARTDVWFDLPPFREDYQLTIVDPGYLTAAVKPKQFLHIDEAECILCEGCVDICPWKCIHYLSVDAIAEATNVDDPRNEPSSFGMFIVDEDVCTRCALCVDRCPTGVISLGKFAGSVADASELQGISAPWQVDSGQRDEKNGYAYGMRF
jgi:ferredoxin